MAVKMRLKRMGKIRAPFYRVVIADSRTKRDGRAIEEIGQYHPTAEPSVIDIDSERAQYWLGVGAQPSEQVKALLKVTGDWQRFTGEPGSEGTLKVAEPRVDKKTRYEAALAAADGAESTTSQRRGRAPAPTQEAPVAAPVEKAPAGAEPPAEQAPAAAETPAEEAPAGAETPAEEASATADESPAAPEGAERSES